MLTNEELYLLEFRVSLYCRVGGKRSYFQKALKKELFEMSAEEEAILNECNIENKHNKLFVSEV